MKRFCRQGYPAGLIIAAAGLFIILAIILPSAFWWLFLGAVLVCVGLMLMKKC